MPRETPPPLETEEPVATEEEQVVEDGIEDASEEEEIPESSMRHYKCGQCGASLRFRPGEQALGCEYCGHRNLIEGDAESVEELDLKTHLRELAESEELEERLTIKCPSCAAETEAQPNVTSQVCPFCGVSIVAAAQSTKRLKPRALLPFQVNGDKAWGLFREWIDSRWFAPGDLKKMTRKHSRLRGMYIPYWTYDSDTTTQYTGQRGEYYYVTRRYSVRVNGKTQWRTRRERRTRWYPASGTVRVPFDDVLVLASNSLPREYAEKLEPWDLQNTVAYDDSFLSGFGAESYQIDLADGFRLADKIMEGGIRYAVGQDIGGDTQRIHSMQTSHDHVTFKHILLPIWISAYRYRDKVFRFLINGRTGEVQGERPWSGWKIAGLVLLITVIVAGVSVIFANVS